MIRSASIVDASQILRIYNYYIENSVATFETTEVGLGEMENRIVEIKDELPWLVWEDDGTITGYAYASKWKGRCAYRNSVESTVYLDPKYLGRGIGRNLYQRMIHELIEKNYHTIIGGISLPNPASVALHEKLGFKKVAHFSEVGRKFNRWIDVGYWQLILPEA